MFSNEFLQKNQHLIDNDTDDVLIKYFMRYKHIINDWGHIILDHLNDDQQKNKQSFRMMFDEINHEIQCDINTCSQYNRYFQNREIKTNSKKKSELQFYIHLMDNIHCYLLHSYDIGFRVKIDRNNPISSHRWSYDVLSETKTEENEKSQAFYLRASDDMDSIQSYLNATAKLSQIIERKDRFTSNIFDDELEHHNH